MAKRERAVWYSFEPKKCHVNVDTTDMHLCTLRFFFSFRCASRTESMRVSCTSYSNVDQLSHVPFDTRTEYGRGSLLPGDDCECSQDGDAQMRAGRHRRHCRATLCYATPHKSSGALPFQAHVTMHVLAVVTLTVLHLSTRHKTYSYWSR